MSLIILVILKALTLVCIGTVITGNLLGTYKQQVGKTFVFATWKGIQYFRKWVKGTYSRTVAQAAQRTMFSAVYSVTQGCLTTIIQKFWKKYAVKMSCYNAWMKYNLLEQTKPVTFNHWIFAKGTLTPTPATLCTYDVLTGTVAMRWNSTLIGNQSADDKCVLIAMSSAGTFMNSTDSGILRSAGQCTLGLADGLDFATLYGYFFFYRDLGTQFEKISNSVAKAVTEP